ncbi:MAG TPA: GNAT family protein, partial [Actinomycetes bacterium]|nr:GNAT family protein [Actinomycetes bacterium]
GYWTHPLERGRGAATHALRLATNWAIEDVGFKRIELIHAVANVGSCSVATRAGFELEGTVRLGERYGDDQWYDEHIHGRVHP